MQEFKMVDISAGILTKNIKFEEQIEVKSESDIPCFSLADVWDEGIDENYNRVVYVLGVLDKYKALDVISKRYRHISQKIEQIWRKIEEFYEKRKPAKLPMLLTAIYRNGKTQLHLGSQSSREFNRAFF